MPTKHVTISVAFVFLCGLTGAEAVTAQTVPSDLSETNSLVVGERMEYRVRLGRLRLGRASLAVEALDEVAGTAVYRAALDVSIGAPMLRFEERLVSWIAPQPFRSLAFEEPDSKSEGGRRRYEFHKDVLDEVSALYLMRALPLAQGATYRFDRYFTAEGNPITFRVLGRESVRVPAGRFETIVIQPVIPSLSVFRQEAGARFWVTDDDRRVLVQIQTRTKAGKLTLYMTNYEEGAQP